MSRKIEDFSQEEILEFQKDIERIISNNSLSKFEKAERIKLRTKEILRDFSYLDLFNSLKTSKQSQNSKYDAKRPSKEVDSDSNRIIYEQAIEELLEEKKKVLSNKELDELLDHFQEETNKTQKFIDTTRKTLLTDEEVSEKSKPLTEDDYNYKRLVVAASERNLTQTEKELLENESKKAALRKADLDKDLFATQEELLSKEASERIDKESKKL